MAIHENILFESCETGPEEVFTYLHNTKSKDIAETILDSGFIFQSHLDYCCDLVTIKDPITIKYFSCIRQAYGAYTLIIQFTKSIVDRVSEPLENYSNHYSEILSYQKPIHEDGEIRFNLAPEFIKGYVDNEKNQFIANPNFNPSHFTPRFNENILAIIKSQQPMVT